MEENMRLHVAILNLDSLATQNPNLRILCDIAINAIALVEEEWGTDNGYMRGSFVTNGRLRGAEETVNNVVWNLEEGNYDYK